MTEASDWRGRVGEAWAEEWRRTDRMLGPVNDALVAAALAQAPAAAHILDVGCGAGATSLALADALPRASITGVDLSASLVAVARKRAGGLARLQFDEGDAADWVPARAGFELIVSRHGVMFFDDPVAAFSHLRALAAPGAALVFSCFRPRADNAWIRALAPVVTRFAPEAAAVPEAAAGPFAFGDPARIESILAAAGFAPPAIAPLDFDFVAGVGEDAVADAVDYFRRIGPFAALLGALSESDRSAASDQLAEIAAANQADGRVSFRAAAWIVRSHAE
jgi:SAM-dependent methyltransferase